MSNAEEYKVFTTHYADEDDWGLPICHGGQDGDTMTFFPEDTKCEHCLNILDGYSVTLDN